MIKMRAGIKMPELPDIELPDKKESKVLVPVVIPSPPIPAGIPTVPIPPDIKLPPGVPFPPLPPAPPPSSSSNGTIPVVIEPVEDIRAVWSKPNAQSIANSSCSSRAVSSSPLSTVGTPRVNHPVTSGLSIDHALERQAPFSDAHFQPITSKSILPIRSLDNRTILSRDSRTSSEIHSQHQDHIEVDLAGIKPLPGEQGHISDPVFRGMPPTMQNVPGPRQGIRMLSARAIIDSLGNRFPPPVPPGPMPQRPMIGNRFPHPVPSVPMQGCFLPSGRMQCDRFPLDQPIHGNRDFRPPMKHMDNPAVRSGSPRNFDIRKFGPRPSKSQEIHDRGREKIPLRETLFDVPRPRRPLDPNLNIDRPERMAPFESQRPSFKPEVQRPQFQPDMHRPSFEPDMQRPPFDPDMQRQPFHTDMQRPPFDPDMQRPPFEPDMQRPPFEPDMQRPPFEPDMQRPPFEPDMQRPPFEPDMQRPPFEPGMQRPPFEPGMQRPPFEPGMQRPPFEPGMQRPPFEPDMQRPFEHEKQRPPYKSDNSINSRTRDERSPSSRDHSRSFLDGMPHYEDFNSTEIDRRDRKHERPEYDRSDPGFSRNSRGKFYHKNRQKFDKYSRHGSGEGRRDPPRSSEFRYRTKNDDVRDRYDSKSFGGREDGPSKAKQKRTRPNKYVALSTHSELEELEEGEVL